MSPVPSRRETLDQAEVGDFRRASQLDRSSLSLLSSDNTIHEEGEGEEVLQVYNLLHFYVLF